VNPLRRRRKPPKRCIGAVLFADVVGFSQLRSDREVIRFFRVFLERVARVTARAPAEPLVSNTWGDGLYLVFGDLRSSGLCALDLSEQIPAVRWSRHGLPPMNIRVALHAGPLYSFLDPVSEQLTWSGKQVTRAARMEPITPPGSVYASREFAALSAAVCIEDFQCEPVGPVRLAKAEGLAPMFVVRRSARY
jgi:class 3 adenylate cyclase